MKRTETSRKSRATLTECVTASGAAERAKRPLDRSMPASFLSAINSNASTENNSDNSLGP